MRDCFSSAGQLCVSMERLVLHDRSTTPSSTGSSTGCGRCGWAPTSTTAADMGSPDLAATSSAASARHVDDAVAKGATVLAGGRPGPTSARSSTSRPCSSGVTAGDGVLRARRRSARSSPSGAVRADAEAVALANETEYGLNASRLDPGRRHGRSLAARSRRHGQRQRGVHRGVGRVASPMGGRRASGLGRRHGREGMLRFTEPQTSRCSTARVSASPRSGPERFSELFTRPAAGRAAPGCHGRDRRGRRGEQPGRGVRPRRRRRGLRLRRLGGRAAAGREGLRRRWSSRPAAGSRTTSSPGRRWDVRRFLWAPRLGCFGVQRIHRLPGRAPCLAGAGVGGGSLNYANTLYVPPTPFFDDPQWARDHRLAGRAGAALRPGRPDARRGRQPVRGPGRARSCARSPTRWASGTPSARPRSGCSSARRDRERGRVPDPFFGGAGPARTGCIECGNCMVGCRVRRQEHPGQELPGARRAARRRGRAAAHRRDLRPLDPRARAAGGGRRPCAPARGGRRAAGRTVTAGQVVLAAGTWGTAAAAAPHARERRAAAAVAAARAS